MEKSVFSNRLLSTSRGGGGGFTCQPDPLETLVQLQPPLLIVLCHG